MHFVGFAELAAAVSNAGGLGIITGLTQKHAGAAGQRDPPAASEMTDKPFGVNLTFLPTFAKLALLPRVHPRDHRQRHQGRGDRWPQSAEPWMPMAELKANGVKVIHKCTSVRHSLKAEAIGCDAVSVDGFECGGHPGEDDVPNFILLPRAAEDR
jgi:NAD(P)H-dependent flavin oxidoreductase YrpB (nitropropane dioxygenase family)